MRSSLISTDVHLCRGPAKGYIEGLEHRLHEAESLLLQLLPYVSAEQLQSAVIALLDHDGADSGRGSPDRRSSPPVLNKKTGIDYWENFPLTSVHDVRRWQQDCEVHGGNHREALVKSETRHVSPQRQANRVKRRSVQDLPASSNAHFVNDENINNDFYMMQTEISPPQQTNRPSQISVPIDGQSRNTWPAPITLGSIGRSNSHSGIPIHQPFSQVNYIPNQNNDSWQLQQAMNLDINTDGMLDPRSSLQGTTQQVHSHLFW